MIFFFFSFSSSLVKRKMAALDPRKNQQICVCTTPTQEKLLVLPQEKEIDTIAHPECVCIHTSDLAHNTFATPPPVYDPKDSSPTTAAVLTLRPGLFHGVNMTLLVLGVFVLPLVLSIFFVYLLMFLSKKGKSRAA
jgi:hypothetical protein